MDGPEESRRKTSRSSVGVAVLSTIFFFLVLLMLFLVGPFSTGESIKPTPSWKDTVASPKQRTHNHRHEYEFVSKQKTKRPFILISMDGFRFDYIEKVKAAGKKVDNFDYLIANGVRAGRVKNAFPTITMPNHQTLVTGLFPESHGITLNTFIDPKFPGERFDMNNQTGSLNDPKWFVGQADPIWVTCQQQGCLTASILWPATDAPVSGDLPFQQVSQFTMLDGGPARYPYKKRVDDLIWHLTNKRYHIDLVLLYFDEPDETGHGYGPNSMQVIDKVVELDYYVGYMISRMKATGLFDKVDMIITADHGMEEISSERQVELNKWVSPSYYSATLLTPVSTIYPNPGMESVVYHSLKSKDPNFDVYLKSEVPAEYNYNKSDRIAPIVGVAKEGWTIVQKKSTSKWIGGNHGYNNSNHNMHPFLIAHGPSFRSNFKTPLLHNVDLYPLMCHLLDIRPNPNNGSLQRIQHILNPGIQADLVVIQHIQIFIEHNFMLTILGLLISVLVLVSIIANLHKRRRSDRMTI